MLKKLSLFQRLVLANILYSLPVIGLIISMIGAHDVNIDFAKQELRGNFVQVPAESLLKELLKLRMEISENIDKNITPANVSEKITDLRKSAESYMTELQLDIDGLKKRNRQNSELSSFEKRWDDYSKALQSADRQSKLDTLNAFIADTRAFITHIGDTSNLILDPDLDSYYLMDITLVAMPQMQDRISEISTFLNLKKDKFTNEDFIQLAVYSALLKQSDLDRIMGDFQTTLNEDPNFYGVSEGLQKFLHPEIKDTQKHLENSIASMTNFISSKNQSDLSILQNSLHQSFESSFKTWFVALEQLDQLLKTRQSTLELQKYKSLAYSLFALIGAVAVLFYISSSFNRNMKSVIDQLKNAVSKTKDSGEELVGLSSDLSIASDEQASALQETSAALEEIRSMVTATLQNTQDARQIANTTFESANQGQSSVQNLLVSIQGISESNQNVLTQVERNRQQMQEITQIISEIGGKTKVINDIVFQTKLLSFNASVEAARAGESGKGFTVVAQEVGNLASMSGNASKDISQMLNTSVSRVNNISEETNKVMSNLMEDSRQNIEKGTRLADNCGEAISIVLEKVTDVINNSTSIQTAAEEQAKGIEEVTIAVQRLDTIAQRNMEMSKKTSLQSKDIAEQAKSLNSIAALVQDEVLGTRVRHHAG